MSLFPAYSTSTSSVTTSTSNNTTTENSASVLFPSVAGTSVFGTKDTLPSASSTSYQSYQPEILEVWQEEKKAQLEILLSSDDDSEADSDDSSVQIIEEITDKEKRHKKKKEAKKKKKRKKEERKRKKKAAKDTEKRRRSRSPGTKKAAPEPDNSYLAYLPKGRANFIEDIPNLRPEDAYRLDRRPEYDNRAFTSLYEKTVSRYHPKDVIYTVKIPREGPPKKKKKKIKRYFKSSKKHAAADSSARFVRARESLPTELDYIPVPVDWNQLPENQTESLHFESMHSADDPGSSVVSSQLQLFHELTREFNRLVADRDQRHQTQLWIDFIRFQDLLLTDSSTSSNNNRKFSAEKKDAITEKALESNRRSVPLNLVKLKLLSAFYAELGHKVSDIDADWKRLCFLFPNIPELWFDYSRFSMRSQSVIAFKAASRTRKIFATAFKNLSGKVLEGDFVSHEVDGSQLEQRLVDLVAMVARFLASIDQTEKATALWQALVEFNLFRPKDLDFEESTFEDWFALFEQFWDSGLSRIGEFSPTTWAKFRALTSTGDVAQLQQPKDSQNEIFNQDKLIDETENLVLEEILKTNSEDSNSQIWLHYERLRHSLHWISASSGALLNASLEDVEDLERVVLSDDDVKPFLFRLRMTESKWYLVKGFLEYLGVPLVTYALDSAGSTSRFEFEDQNTAPPNTDALFLSTTSNSKLFESTLSCTRFSRFEFPSELIVLQKFGLESLLNSRLESHGLSLRLHDDLSRQDNTAMLLKNAFVSNLMEKMVEYAKEWPGEWRRDLVLIWVRYRMARVAAGLEKAKNVRKFIKEFLREESFRNCLDLWFAYCSFEFTESRESGRKFFANTIQLMLSGPFLGPSVDLLQFTLGYVRLELDFDLILHHFLYHTTTGSSATCLVCTRRSSAVKQEDVDEDSKALALKFLIAVISGDSSGLVDLKKNVSSVEIVRAAKKLEEEPQRTEVIHARVVLEYLGKGITEASALLTNLSNAYSLPVSSTTRSHYLLHLQLLLHAYHLAYPSPRPTLTRSLITTAQSVLKSALHAFPSDPLFLSLLVSFEITFNSLWFRLRRHFGVSSTSQFESYLVRQYLVKSQETANQPQESQESNWNRFMASLHGELLILDRIAQAQDLDLTAFDINSGILNRIRHLFERVLHYRDAGTEDSSASSANSTAKLAMDDDWLYGKSLADCPTIWRLFLRFELKCAQQQQRTAANSGAKAIIYRSLQHCPNHKALYLDGINFCPELFQEFVDIMTDKQLRVRTTVEEVEMFVEAKKE